MIYVPWPPSVNNYYTVVKGRKVLSKKGRAYKRTIWAELTQQSAPKGIKGPYSIFITASPPDKRKHDVDNLLKPLLDGLCEYGTISDDSEIDDLRILRMHPKPGGEIGMRIYGGDRG